MMKGPTELAAPRIGVHIRLVGNIIIYQSDVFGYNILD